MRWGLWFGLFDADRAGGEGRLSGVHVVLGDCVEVLLAQGVGTGEKLPDEVYDGEKHLIYVFTRAGGDLEKGHPMPALEIPEFCLIEVSTFTFSLLLQIQFIPTEYGNSTATPIFLKQLRPYLQILDGLIT